MNNILIVDDQPYIRLLISKSLNGDGYHVVGVADVDRMWAHIDESKPDMVLVNLEMQECNSWEILNDIRGKNPDLPAINYALKSQDAVGWIKQAVTQVLNKKLLFPPKSSRAWQTGACHSPSFN
jgi:DNA-binding NtrC family response regulator